MPQDQMPIATYREVRFDGKRRFDLFSEEIRVSGSVTMQSDLDTTIPLSRMDPRLIKLRVRNNVFWVGLWMAIAGFVGAVILVEGFRLDPFGIAPGLIGSIGVAGIALSCATLRKTEYARFESDAGVPVLDIARSGPDVASFNDFVDRLLKQIRDCRDGQ